MLARIQKFGGTQLLLWSIPALLAFCPPRVNAATIVTGTVVDQQTHQPIAGAVVSAVGAPARSTTGESGEFTLRSEKDFTSIVVSRIGYVRQQIAVPGTGLAMQIELTASALEVPGTEITGRALVRSQLDQAEATGTLTAQDLGRASGLSLENSINTLPGVLMQSRTPWGGAHVMIRGYYPNFSQNSNGYGYQLFLNEIPVTDASGLTVMDDIDIASLGAVRVIKGPSSSQYGGAIAGSVLLRTAEPVPGTTSLTQQLTGGSDGLFRTNTTLQTADEYSSMLVSYGHQTYDSFRPNSGSRKDFARFTGTFHAGPKHSLMTYFSYNNSYEQIAGELDSTDFYNRREIDNPVYALNRSQIRIESNRIALTDDHRLSEALGHRLTLFTTTQTFRQPFAHGFSDANRFNFGARSVLDMHAKAASATLDGAFGGQFQRTNYTANGFNLPSNNPSDQENYAMNYYAFTEWKAALPSQVFLTVGVTVSKNEFGIRNMLKNRVINDTTRVLRRAFDPEFTPRAALLKVFSDAVSLYASAGAGYTSPSLSSVIASDNSINTALKPEHAVQYELGTKGLLLKRKLSYELAVFDLENTDKLVSQKVGTVSFTTNIGKQRNRGAELTLSALLVDDPSETISLLRPWVTYTYSDFKYIEFRSDNNNTAATVDFSGKTVARTPEQVFNCGFDAATRSGFYLFGSYQHVGSAYVTFNNTNGVKAYDLLNAKAGYQRQLNRHFHLDLSAGGDNLLNNTYYTFLFVGPNFTGLAQSQDGGTGDGYIIPGPYEAAYFGGARVTYSF